LALKVITGFSLNPCGVLLIVEILALPSTVAIPSVSDLLSIAIDYICEYLPRSTESSIVLVPLVTVAISIKNIF
jgi:hypothetical protein